MKKKNSSSENSRKYLRNVDRSSNEPFFIPEAYSRIDPVQMQDLQMSDGSLGFTTATGNATGIIVCYEVPLNRQCRLTVLVTWLIFCMNR